MAVAERTETAVSPWLVLVRQGVAMRAREAGIPNGDAAAFHQWLAGRRGLGPTRAPLTLWQVNPLEVLCAALARAGWAEA